MGELSLPSGGFTGLADRGDTEAVPQAASSQIGQSEFISLLEGAGDLATFSWDAATGQQRWSPNVHKLLGCEPGVPQGLPAMLARLDAESQSRLREFDPSRTPAPVELHVLESGAELTLQGQLGAEGSWLCLLRDVTAQRRAEGALARVSKELAEHQRRWETFLSNPYDFFAVIDAEGVYRWVNHVAPEVPADAIIGKARVFDFLEPKDYAMVASAIDQALRLGESTYYEAYCPPLGRWFGTVVAPAPGGGEGLVAVLARDISQAKETERELRRRGRMLAEAERLAQVGSWQWDSASGRLDWSESLYRIFGVPLGQQPSVESYFALVHEEDRERVRATSEEIIRTGAPVTHEYRIVRGSDGQLRHLQTTGDLIRDADGQVIGFIGATVDLTERRELEARLSRSQRLEALGRLAGGLAHDFNNVLTVILGQVELAGRGAELDGVVSDALATIRQASERASRMTHQLLAFSRRQVLEPRALDPRSEMLALVRLLQPLLGEHIRVELKLAEDTWPIKLDPSQFEQLVSNLILNARDAMEHGGVLTLSSANEAGPGGDTVHLTVADTGVGMTESVRQQLFEPFFTTKAQGKGTGLGLPTCEGIVTQAGGRIGVESQPGGGSSFHVSFPRCHEPVARVRPISEYPQSLAGQETILVVEDMALIRRLCTRVLGGLGYKVLSAETGAEAVAAARSHDGPIDLVMMDMVLPDRPGREVVEELRAYFPSVRVLYTSGYSHEGLPAGAAQTKEHFLPKPYTPTSLSRKARQILDGGSP